MLTFDKILEPHVFGVGITLLAYISAKYVNKYFFFEKIPPVCLAALVIIVIINLFSFDYKEYKVGGSFISYILGPATIALALPLVKNMNTLKKNLGTILIGTFVATVVGILSVYWIAEFLKTSNELLLSILPKSVTTPIAVEISKAIGGIPELTSCMVIITGLVGGYCGHRILNFLKVYNNISIGLAIGASSHVFGTSRCIEKNEVQAAISTLALILVGILTAILAPIAIKVFF